MIPDKLKQIARNLRKNQTPEENILWKRLKRDTLGERILRQKVFYVYTEYNGFKRFIIPDFYIARKKIIIEIDGSIHNLDNVFNLDKLKEELIKQRGFKVLRFTNDEIHSNLDFVINKIKLELNK